MMENSYFYCEMCETKHSRIEPRAQCPACGRRYCHKSLENVLQTGVKKCPYCDGAIEKFSGLSWALKEQLGGMQTFEPEEDTVTKYLAGKKLVYKKEDAPQIQEAWSNEIQDFNFPTVKKADLIDNGVAMDEDVLHIESILEEKAEEIDNRVLSVYGAMEKKDREAVAKSAWKARRRKRHHRFGKPKKPRSGFADRQMEIMKALQPTTKPTFYRFARAGFIAAILVLSSLVLIPIITGLMGVGDNIGIPMDCKFRFGLYGDGEFATDGQIAIYEDAGDTHALEVGIIRTGWFTSARYYEPTSLIHIRYTGSDIWGDQNRTVIVLHDYIGGEENFPRDTPGMIVEIKAMFLTRQNTTEGDYDV